MSENDQRMEENRGDPQFCDMVRAKDFCTHCGARMDPIAGESTCEKCDPGFRKAKAANDGLVETARKCQEDLKAGRSKTAGELLDDFNRKHSR